MIYWITQKTASLICDKLGDTLADLPESQRYDWVVCSVFIENFAELLQILERLSRHLMDKGLMYVEVPMELEACAAPGNVVIHVNFLTPASLRCILLRTGLCVKRVRLGVYPHPIERHLFAVRSVTRRRCMRPGQL